MKVIPVIATRSEIQWRLTMRATRGVNRRKRSGEEGAAPSLLAATISFIIDLKSLLFASRSGCQIHTLSQFEG